MTCPGCYIFGGSVGMMAANYINEHYFKHADETTHNRVITMFTTIGAIVMPITTVYMTILGGGLMPASGIILGVSYNYYDKYNPANKLASLTQPIPLIVGVVGGTAINWAKKLFQTDVVESSDCGCKSLGNIAHSEYVPMSFDKTIVANLNKIPSAPTMVGGDGDDLLIADEDGSKMFGKAGLNLFIGRDGAKDEFYFSMCSTKPRDHSVCEVRNFESGRDKLKIFCSKRTVDPKELTIKSTHVKSNEATDISYTMVEIENPNGPSVIVVLGAVTMEDIIFNERWVA